MPRYIDADELLKVLDVFSDKEGEKADFFAQKNLDELSTKYNHGQYCYENVKNIVNTMPTADADEVVRCEDCAVPHNMWTGCPKLNGLIPPPNFFCKCGTRKDDSNDF